MNFQRLWVCVMPIQRVTMWLRLEDWGRTHVCFLNPVTRVGISFMVKGGVSYRCDKGAQRLREKLANGKVAVQPSDYPLSLLLLLPFSSPSIPSLLHLSCCPFLPAVPYVLFSLTYSLFSSLLWLSGILPLTFSFPFFHFTLLSLCLWCGGRDRL